MLVLVMVCSVSQLYIQKKIMGIMSLIDHGNYELGTGENGQDCGIRVENGQYICHRTVDGKKTDPTMSPGGQVNG